MKDKEQKRGRLYILFARGYIGFTLALLLITGSTFYISELYFDALLRVPDVDQMCIRDSLYFRKKISPFS